MALGNTEPRQSCCDQTFSGLLLAQSALHTLGYKTIRNWEQAQHRKRSTPLGREHACHALGQLAREPSSSENRQYLRRLRSYRRRTMKITGGGPLSRKCKQDAPSAIR